MTDPAAGLSVLHVIVRAGETNSQYNEHVLPVLADRDVTVCSLLPADVTPPPSLRLFEGNGTVRGCWRVLRRALEFREYDVVHVHAPASGIVTLSTYWRMRRSRRDLVFTVHNSWQSFRLRNRLFLRLIIALFPLVVVCGNAARASMPRRVLRRWGHKISVVPNGVDVGRIDGVLAGLEPPEPPRRGTTVVSVARLIPIKDPLAAVEAFAAAAGDHDRLLMIGEGPLRPAVEEAAHEREVVDALELTGLVPREDVYRRLRGSDVFLSTSRGEGLPVAMLEAMACGLPVVASDIPPHREIAAVAKYVPLVPPGDIAGFSRALARVLALSDEERRRSGEHLRHCVAEHFSVSAMNRRYGEIYAGVAAAQPARRGRLHAAELVPPDAQGLGVRLRRRVGLLVTLGLLGGIAGYLVGGTQTSVYKAETTLVVGPTAGAASEEELQLSGALAMAYADLARREPVLGPVADEGFADGWRELQPDVHVETGTKNPNLLQISAFAPTPDAATALAGAVSDQLIEVAETGASSPRHRFVRDQVAGLQQAADDTAEELAAVTRSLSTATGDEREQLEARAADLRRDLFALQSSYADLAELDIAAIGLLSTVDEPWVGRSPLRPTPAVLAVAGAAFGLILAAGLVHLFDRGRTPSPAPVPGTTAGPVWNAVPTKKRGTLP